MERINEGNLIMTNIFKRLGKTGTAVATILTIITGFLALLPVYHSLTRKNLNGKWKITCNIESSTYRTYIGKSSGFRVSFKQDGDNIKGEGETCWIDDKEIPSSQHTIITMEGNLDGDDLYVTYVLHGARRQSSGFMKLKIVSDKEMTGTFDGTAASAKGVASAQMLN